MEDIGKPSRYQEGRISGISDSAQLLDNYAERIETACANGDERDARLLRKCAKAIRDTLVSGVVKDA